MSRWLVGSSSSRMSGAETRARASSTRRLVPPERAANSASASRLRRLSTRSTSWCRRPAAALLQAVLQRLQLRQQGRVGFPRQAVGQMVIIGQQVGGIAHAGGDDVEDRPGQVQRHVLGDQGHPEPLLAMDLAAVRGQLAGNQLQQGRFAGAVAPHQAESVPRLDLQVDAVEQGRAAEGQGDVAQGNQGHGMPW